MNPDEARKAIQEAFYRGRYFLDPHALKRMSQRHISFHDIKNAVMKASNCRPYSDPNRTPSPGASLWRVSGNDLDGDRLEVGIDLVVDHLGSHATVTTVF